MRDDSPAALELSACAKLNLFLHLVGRRDDGYHLLQTLFQLIDLCDQIRLEPAPAGVIELAPGSDAPGGNDDLVLQAARALARAAQVQAGVRIRLDKRIPAGGGLGGGSSDAATVLLGLNRLWGLDWSEDDLAELGAGLGADVPVFVRGRTAWGEGIGERLLPIDTIPAWFVVVAPRVQVSTAAVFSDAQLTRDTPVSRIPALFSGGGQNDCEAVVRRRYPEVDRALQWLSRFGAARLTGTGACVFLACKDAARARMIAAQCPAGFDVFTAASLEVSPTLQELAEQF